MLQTSLLHCNSSQNLLLRPWILWFTDGQSKRCCRCMLHTCICQHPLLPADVISEQVACCCIKLPEQHRIHANVHLQMAKLYTSLLFLRALQEFNCNKCNLQQAVLLGSGVGVGRGGGGGRAKGCSSPERYLSSRGGLVHVIVCCSFYISRQGVCSLSSCNRNLVC